MSEADTSSGAEVRYDADGFLERPEAWSRELAEAIARVQGVAPLTTAHWRVIDYLRAHHLSHGTVPVARHACLGQGLDEHCVDDLFRGDLMVAWRIAGLPNPGEEAQTYS